MFTYFNKKKVEGKELLVPPLTPNPAPPPPTPLLTHPINLVDTGTSSTDPVSIDTAASIIEDLTSSVSGSESEESNSTQNIPPTSLVVTGRRCIGFIPPFPDGKFQTWYPYSNIYFHTTLNQKPFEVGDGFVRSYSCEGQVLEGNICIQCNNLQYNPFLKNVVAKANLYQSGNIENTPNEMLSHGMVL